MNDQLYHEERLQDLNAQLEDTRADQRFDSGVCKYGIIAGAASLALGCAINYFGSPEYHVFADNLMKFSPFIACGGILYWLERIVDTEDEVLDLERKLKYESNYKQLKLDFSGSVETLT